MPGKYDTAALPITTLRVTATSTFPSPLRSCASSSMIGDGAVKKPGTSLKVPSPLPSSRSTSAPTPYSRSRWPSPLKSTTATDPAVRTDAPPTGVCGPNDGAAAHAAGVAEATTASTRNPTARRTATLPADDRAPSLDPGSVRRLVQLARRRVDHVDLGVGDSLVRHEGARRAAHVLAVALVQGVERGAQARPERRAPPGLRRR